MGSMTPTIASIRRATCEVFGLTEAQLLGEQRGRYVSHPRQLAMYLARELTEHSLPTIGRYMGGRDHSTILHGCRQVERRKRQGETSADLRLLRGRILAMVDGDGDGVSGD